MAVLEDKWHQFWQVIAPEDRYLFPGFWAEEEERSRLSVRNIGLCGLVLVSSLGVTNLIFFPDFSVELGILNLLIFMLNLLFVFNQRPSVRRIPIEALFYTGFFVFVVGATFAGVLLKEIIPLVLAVTVLVVVLVVVSGFNRWVVVAVLLVPIAYALFLILVGGADNPLYSYISAFTFTAPFFVLFVNRSVFKQRWLAYLARHQLEVQTAVLAEANQLLAKRNEELDAFAHTVAHDLKNPLTIVVGYAEIVADEMEEEGDERWLEFVHNIVQAGRKGNTIIQELLLLAAVRKEDIRLSPLPMARIVGQALERLSHHLEEEQVALVQPEEWPTVQGYAGWVEEVWVNYISNAIKYGGRPCCVELGATAVSDRMVRFWVKDNGKGLSPEEQAVLFTEFTRLDEVRAKGHGLGLSIVRRIMEKLNGRVGIESSVGKGSTFYFELPA